MTINDHKYLRPVDSLTEAQFFMILFRLTRLEEFYNTKSMDSHWINVVYQFAEAYQLPTTGAVEKLYAGDTPMTRGQVGKLLVAYHTNNPFVTMEDVIRFMYENNYRAVMTN